MRRNMKDVIIFVGLILILTLLAAIGDYMCGPDVPISEEALSIVREYYLGL